VATNNANLKFAVNSTQNATVNNVKEEEIKETLEDSVLPLPTNATVNNVKEEEIKETLEDSNLPLPTNATVNNAKDLVLPLTKSLTFKEVREYAENAGYEIEPLGGMFRLIKNNVIKTFPSLKTLQLFITEELVEKKEITLEDSDLPSPDNNAIALVGKVTEVKILTKMVAVNPAVHHEVKLILIVLGRGF
jgi:hypothetical protein